MTDTQNISIDDFLYPLPDERIARHPLAVRDSCKLLVADKDGVVSDNVFSALTDFLDGNTLLVYNNTRVINARLRFTKPSGGVIEIFCLEPYMPVDYQQCFSSTQPVVWRCFVGNSKRWKSGLLQGVIDIDGHEVVLSAERLERGDGDSLVRLSWDGATYTFAQIIASAGEIPIPPYLGRSTEPADLVDYQTVFADIEGSVAAPTAGLHFTPELLGRLEEKGVKQAHVTLHVGAGTFQPVKSATIGGHDMHSEYIVIDRELVETLASTDRTVVAVGTTSVRTLESLYHIGCLMEQGRFDGTVPQWYPYENNHPALTTRHSLENVLAYLKEKGTDKLVASTRIIIAPGYEYHVVRKMITNFHQPGSTLLLLVSAFIGEAWHEVYDYALKHDYRFLSYGDACLFQP